MTERDLRNAATAPGAETFVRTFELFEHAQAGTLLGLLLQKLVLLGGGLLQLDLQFLQARLPLLHRAALGLPR